MNRKCEFCGAKLSKNDTFCKDCGMTINKKVVDAVLEENKLSKINKIPKKILYIIIFLVVLIFILIMI